LQGAPLPKRPIWAPCEAPPKVFQYGGESATYEYSSSRVVVEIASYGKVAFSFESIQNSGLTAARDLYNPDRWLLNAPAWGY